LNGKCLLVYLVWRCRKMAASLDDFAI